VRKIGAAPGLAGVGGTVVKALAMPRGKVLSIVSRYVFILGAGASKHAGAPLMLDFIDRARELFAANQASEYAADLRRVFTAISNLQAVHSKAELDFVNLEAVFSAFEMAELLAVKPFEPDLVRSMRRLIAWTLDETVRCGVRIRPHTRLLTFTNLHAQRELRFPPRACLSL
jgi:hypothetical protein